MGYVEHRENMTVGEIVAELRLEARMRRAVYGKKVRAGEMGEAEMWRKVALDSPVGCESACYAISISEV